VSKYKKSHKEHIFESENCFPKDEFCYRDDSTIVWKFEEVSHKCPYDKIRLGRKLTWEKDKFLVNRVENLLLEPTKKISICDFDKPIEAYETSEGLIIANISSDIIWDIGFQDSDIDKKLLISTIDFSSYKDLDWIKMIDLASCSNLNTQLSVARLMLTWSNFRTRMF
jgi:hypothetical protein